MKLILSLSALFALCSTQHTREYHLPLNIEILDEDLETISTKLSTAVDDITKYYHFMKQQIPEFIHFRISSPTVSGKSYSNKVSTSEFFKTVKNYETFNITNELGSFVFGNIKQNALSLYQYFNKQTDPLFNEVAIHDFDYFDRSDIAFLKTHSGLRDGNADLTVRHRELTASVTTESGEFISNDLVNAPLHTFEYYTNMNQSTPKYLYIKVSYSTIASGISAINHAVLEVYWPDQLMQSCKYLGRFVSESSLKARLEVCRFLVIKSGSYLTVDSNYITREKENLPKKTTVESTYRINNDEATREFEEGFDVTFVVDKNFAFVLKPIYKNVVKSIVKQANYYFQLPRFSFRKKIKLHVNGIKQLTKKESSKIESLNDKKALSWFKRYTMNNKRFRTNLDRNTTEIVVLLREKHNNNLATSYFGSFGNKSESLAVVSYESIEESARLLAREVSHIMGIDDIENRYGKNYTESPNVQYIMTGNKPYQSFDASKQVDWSTSTQEQSRELNGLHKELLINSSPKRRANLKNAFSFEDQCHVIYRFDGFLPKIKNQIKAVQNKVDKCKVLTCEYRSDEKVLTKRLIPLEGTPCGYNSVCTNGYCRNEITSDLMDSEWHFNFSI